MKRASTICLISWAAQKQNQRLNRPGAMALNGFENGAQIGTGIGGIVGPAYSAVICWAPC
jgi:hypothetical protein